MEAPCSITLDARSISAGALSQGQKVLKFEFAIEAIIIFIKSIKKGIRWYVHFIGKSTA